MTNTFPRYYADVMIVNEDGIIVNDMWYLMWAEDMLTNHADEFTAEEWEDMYDFFSDMSKDVYGFRYRIAVPEHVAAARNKDVDDYCRSIGII